jgi:hypothetical protein
MVLVLGLFTTIETSVRLIVNIRTRGSSIYYISHGKICFESVFIELQNTIKVYQTELQPNKPGEREKKINIPQKKSYLDLENGRNLNLWNHFREQRSELI